MPTVKKNTEALTGEIERQTNELFNRLFTITDDPEAQEWLASIGPALARAAIRDDGQRVDELEAQLRGVQEIYEIQARDGAQDTALGLFDAGIRSLAAKPAHRTNAW